MTSIAGRKRNYQGDYSDLKPSCVLHLRELPGHTLEIDLLNVFTGFGPIKYVSMIPDSHQALLEFYDIRSAQSVVEKFRETGITLNNGSAIKLNYSTSTSISLRSVNDADQAESPILGLTVYRANYPIHTELVHKIVSQYGKPLKILIIRKKNIVAFVEFVSIQEAKKVKMYLNGADVYSGCCSLKVDFAPNRPLRISYNNNEQWDGTLEGMEHVGYPGLNSNPAMNMAHMTNDGSGSLLGDRNSTAGVRYPPMDPTAGRLHLGHTSGPAAAYLSDPHFNSLGLTSTSGIISPSPVVLIHGLNMDEINCDRIFNIACIYGNVMRVKFLRSKEGSCMVQMGDEIAAQNIIDNFSGAFLFNKRISIHASNQVMLQQVVNPYNLPDGSASYKEFSNSVLNRFFTRDRASKNRICRPNATLHFWNCPPNFSEREIAELFDDPGIMKPQQVLLFNQSDKSSSGLVEWSNANDATNALAVVNHKTIILDDCGDKARDFREPSPWYIKLSYGVSAIKSRSGRGRDNAVVY